MDGIILKSKYEFVTFDWTDLCLDCFEFYLHHYYSKTPPAALSHHFTITTLPTPEPL